MRGSLLIIIAVAAAVYAKSLSAPFVFDDLASISDNPSIRQLGGALSPPNRGEAVSGRPLVNLSLAVNYAAGGLSVRGYHLVNIALHVACALLLFAIVRETISDDRIALACAIVWMVHPIQTEVVDYTVARTESMMALCLLLTLYAAIRKWTTVAIAACAAGMACKETMVVAPVLVMLWYRCFRGGRRNDSNAPLFLGLALTWLVLIALLVSAPRAHSAGFAAADAALHPATAWNYLLNQAVMITRYLRLMIWPSGFVLDYGFPQRLSLGDVLPQMIVIAALVAGSAIAVVRWPAAGFLGAWFFLTLAPSSSIVPIATEVGAERRMYLPSMAIVVFAVIIAWRYLKPHRAAAAAVLGSVVALCGGATVARTAEYQSPLTLWSTNVDRWPNGRARANLAAALHAAGRYDEAIGQWRSAIADFPEARYDLGAQLAAHGAEEEGERELRRFVEQFPTHPNAAAARAQIARLQAHAAARLTDVALGEAKAGRLHEAIAAFKKVVDLVPENANAHRNLANALLDARDFAGASAQAREALRLNPGDAVAKEILALASEKN